ncbi:MAG: endonuclease Q family protein [Nanoarchaeota archaeon]|nr:endonuclease Q family protein [Nanoarchaeota archaeon]
MKIIADLHMHSKYSRATSKNMTIENIDKYAKIKGLNLIGTSDFTHPIWFKTLKQNLNEYDSGIYQYKNKNIRFMLTGEISLMYKQDEKGRRVHFLIFAPNFEIAEQITDWLKTKGRVDYDGRPIFGFTSIEFVEAIMNISKDIMLIPAHIMTPYFGILGQKGGFNSLEECFGDQVKHIHAVETGISADPEMLWRISSLDKFTPISNSDSHSYYTWRIGREANVFELKTLTYKNIINAIKTRKGFKYTIETPPEYGRYHWDGHRVCNVFFSPAQTKKLKGICPVCKKPLTIGVEYRIEELADRKIGFKPKNAIPFKRMLPLAEILSGIYGTGISTNKVQIETNKLVKEFGSELNVLLNVSENQLKLLVNEKIANIIIKNRNGELSVQPGYDGIYGKLLLNDKIKTKI